MPETGLHEHDDAIRSAEGQGETFEEIAAQRYSRRDVLKTGAAAAMLVLSGPVARAIGSMRAPAPLRFSPISPSSGADLIVARDYKCMPLLKWGDPIVSSAQAFVPGRYSVASQSAQFGYNCDYVGYLPLPLGSKSSDRGMLVVNHEYTNPELMFPGFDEANPKRENIEVELAAHGMSVVEVRRGTNGEWSAERGSRYNRRLTGTTEFEVSGPAAGAEMMKTKADPTGRRVLGTIGNCAGGKTPWGTVLSGEENFQDYFANMNTLSDSDPLKKIHSRYGVNGGASRRQWEKHFDRFDAAKEPNEANRFGWVVEVDPYDPGSKPKKRTALGRIRHEGATTTVTKGGKVVLYTGDDARFEYVYKFVSAKSYNPTDRSANRDLLDEGTLYVAKFDKYGSGTWLPLVYGQGPLTMANGFRSQADVLINTRGAADLLGATKMDRPEDMETNPVTGKVYLALTNNTQRGTAGRDGADAMNPVAPNRHGHIIEMEEEGGDHAATRFRWNIFLLCGDPKDESTYFAGYPKEGVSAISCPDNITFDSEGNMWIATDGMDSVLKFNDAVFAVPVEGQDRGRVMQFFSAVPGAEVCGPEFTPNDTTLFLAIQHPGDGGTYEEPASRWPDYGTSPPRPTVVAIQSLNGSKIGR